MTIEQLKLQIKEVIFPNGKNEIDGGKHQGVLLDLVDKFDVDIRDLDRELKELSDELNKKVDNESYNIDKEAIETSISENKTAIESNKEAIDKNTDDISEMKESYELDKESQKELDERQNIDLAKHSKSIDELNNLVKVATSKDEPILTAEGGGIISLPSNAMSSVAPNYRISGLTIEQLVKNGDFRDGITSWDVGGNISNVSISDGSMRFIGGGELSSTVHNQIKNKNYIGDNNSEDLYYSAVILESISDGGTAYVGNGFVYTGTKEVGVASNLSKKHTSSLHSPMFSMGASEGCEVVVSNCIFINITQTFGKGNEPTKEWCDEHIQGYFEGTKSVQTPLRIKSVAKDNSNESSLYLNNNLELKSVGEVKDYIENGKLYKYISDDGQILEQPEIVNLSTSGSLTTYPNGTIFIEPVTNITDYYTDSLDVGEYNIVEIEEFSYYKEGVYHQLDTSKVVIKEGKLTYPDLENTIVYMVFKYDDNPIYGVNSVDYYNDKGVLVSPDGSFWKPTMDVDNEGNVTLKGEKL